ncbi:MAG: hypothetical protein AB1830_04695 [Pseudomonadota bacterium]
MAEGLNSKIMAIKRRGCGYRNPEQDRHLLLLWCPGPLLTLNPEEPNLNNPDDDSPWRRRRERRHGLKRWLTLLSGNSAACSRGR